MKMETGQKGPTAYCAAAVGTTIHRTAGCQIATTTIPTTGTTTTDFGWCIPYSSKGMAG